MSRSQQDLALLAYEQAMPILSAVNDDIASEIQKTLDFFKQISATDRMLDKLYLCGGTSQVANITDALSDRLGAEVELMNPFRKVTPSGRDASPEMINDMMPTASVAVGLALRKVGD